MRMFGSVFQAAEKVLFDRGTLIIIFPIFIFNLREFDVAVYKYVNFFSVRPIVKCLKAGLKYVFLTNLIIHV
jgi:hypothetical protein